MNYMVYIHTKLHLANEIQCIKNELKNALDGKLLCCVVSYALPCYMRRVVLRRLLVAHCDLYDLLDALDFVHFSVCI